MISKALRQKCIRAASVYLNMRGYQIMEEGWHQGRYSIDIIAVKKGVIYFLTTYHVKDDLDTPQDYYSEAEEKSKLNAVESWLESNKYSGKHAFGDITLLGKDLSIIGLQIGEAR